MTVRFEKVEAKRRIRVKCRGCGKVRNRVITQWATRNPFNKNADGTIKTRDEIYAEVRVKAADEAARMEREGVVCRNCEAGQ